MAEHTLAGATIYPCPLPGCHWEHVQLEPGLEENPGTLADVFGWGTFAATATARRLQKTEEVLREHLSSHPLEEWARALTEAHDRIRELEARDARLP